MFPLPPASTPPAAGKPARKARQPAPTFDEPPPSKPAPSAPTPAAEPTPPRKPSDGLFQHRPADGGSSSSSDDDKDSVDQFKIGPVAGVGIPSVVSIGGTLKLTRFLGAGANIGIIPKVKLSYYGDATLSYQHYDIYGRLYPFGGGFFLSGGAGYATVDGTLSSKTTVPVGALSGSVDYNSTGSVRTLMLTALIGYFYTTSVGFSFGIDAGAQIPIAPSKVSYAGAYDVTVTGSTPDVNMAAEAQAKSLAAPEVAKTEQSVRDTLEKIGRSTLPTVNLRIGWIL